ncbi:MAG: hypothetical protein AABX16_00950 [Nanoarchaeota archaeon]
MEFETFREQFSKEAKSYKKKIGRDIELLSGIEEHIQNLYFIYETHFSDGRLSSDYSTEKFICVALEWLVIGKKLNLEQLTIHH